MESTAQNPVPAVRVLLVDDDAMVRDWVRLAVAGTEFALAGTAETAEEAVSLVELRRPDVLLADYRLPDLLGTQLVRRLREEVVTAPAIIMTASPERGFNEIARESGAQGSVLKTGRVDELLDALRAVVAGRESFDRRHPRRPPGRGVLSPREREVLQMVAAGFTNREIASRLGVGDETVKTLLGRTFVKLGVRRRAEAVATAHEQGLL